ncbi:DNA-binding transcription factor [Lithospermum erythrorhizon]|uniref:DNA-binding transcription factor n=1 Tax=Lithospermum erythrorhizon TaxID=34254 RepID=A0AAV3NT24_LITER
MMVKTKAYGEFGSGGKRRFVRQNSSIGKGNNSFPYKRNMHPITRSKGLSNGISSCLIAFGPRPLAGCLKTLSTFSIPAASSTWLLSSARWPEKLGQPMAAEGCSWLITKKRLSGVRKKCFTSLTPFAFPKVKPKQSFFTYNISHVPPPPLSRGNLKFLFEKRLQKSDVGSLKRVILPKHPTEKYLPTLESKEGFFIWMDDMDGEHVWKFKFRYWPNNTSRMYVLESTGDFTDEHNLEEGDHILFYQDCDSDDYVVQGKKAKGPKDTDIDYEVQDSSSEVSDDDTCDDDLPCEATSPLKQEENGVINYFVYRDCSSTKFHSNKLKNIMEDIPPDCPLFPPAEGEGGDDDIDKYLCLEGPESSRNSAVVGTGVVRSEEALTKQDEESKGVAHEDEGNSNNQIDNARQVAINLPPVEQVISLKGGLIATTPAKDFENLDDLILCAPDYDLEEIALKVDEWGMPYGYETSLTKDPSFDFWPNGGF